MNRGKDYVIANKKSRKETIRPIYYIISPCHYSALGLSTLTHQLVRKVIVIGPGEIFNSVRFSHQSNFELNSRLVVYLPNEPYIVLVTLKYLSLLIEAGECPVNILLLSNQRPSWLYNTLQNLVSGKKKKSAIRVINPGSGISHIFRLLQKKNDAFPLLEKITREKSTIKERIDEGITKRELDVMLKLLDGNTIMEQSIESNLSIKTLYSQKITGLKKLSEQFISLNKLLPGRNRIRQGIAETQIVDDVRQEENILNDAVKRGLVFQVYQPVIDIEMKIQGFEVLSRWYKEGRELLPDECFSFIQTEKSWIIITACALKNAIEKINQFKGEYWFSVNIPSCLSDSTALLRMLNIAKKQLSSPELLDRLILEFSEDANWSKDAPSVLLLKKLCEQNYQVFLDDCFSDKSVIFPIRQVSFSGYKLDASVINSSMYNNDDYLLVKGLLYYSKLTGSQCIAMGVDTREKFLALKKLGVTAFQGIYFSRPALSEELDMVLANLKKQTMNHQPTIESGV